MLILRYAIWFTMGPSTHPYLAHQLSTKDARQSTKRYAHCNTSGVLNTKTCHVIICIAHHSCVSENFDMHTLKQVYLYVICVDLHGLN